MICAYGPQAGRLDSEKDQLYEEMACECDLQNPGEVVLGLGDLNDMMRARLLVLKMYMMDIEMAKEMLSKDCSSFAMKMSCVW